jgi:hypothetical protein
MHLKKLNELEVKIQNTVASGTLTPQETHEVMSAITYCTKARFSLECSRCMEGVFYLTKAESILNKLEK